MENIIDKEGWNVSEEWLWDKQDEVRGLKIIVEKMKMDDDIG